ncbi:MAG: hypothetical protein ACQJCO_06890 [cyanobacterium endosymbiont of Rhopalodia sterrenbergii]
MFTEFFKANVGLCCQSNFDLRKVIVVINFIVKANQTVTSTMAVKDWLSSLNSEITKVNLDLYQVYT